jgi:branched-subunit amino acid transport protein
LGTRPLPIWLTRALRYTAVAVLPALVAPGVLWPAATGGSPDPARLSAALVTLGVGLITRSTLWAILAGGVTLYALLATVG